jgi:hypothetical protein
MFFYELCTFYLLNYVVGCIFIFYKTMCFYYSLKYVKKVDTWINYIDPW